MLQLIDSLFSETGRSWKIDEAELCLLLKRSSKDVSPSEQLLNSMLYVRFPLKIARGSTSGIHAILAKRKIWCFVLDFNLRLYS